MSWREARETGANGRTLWSWSFLAVAADLFLPYGAHKPFGKRCLAGYFMLDPLSPYAGTETGKVRFPLEKCRHGYDLFVCGALRERILIRHL
ncbi:MAG: hypothetical protein PHD67_09805 [Oscillospiraceae bacterium]|nr:hypothetical protein [Oscillospiraceae bacterium]